MHVKIMCTVSDCSSHSRKIYRSLRLLFRKLLSNTTSCYEHYRNSWVVCFRITVVGSQIRRDLQTGKMNFPRQLILLFAILFLFIDKSDGFLFKKTIKETLIALSSKVEERQPKEDKKSSLVLPWKLDKGTYESVVKLNFHGAPEMAAIRKNFAVNDNNMFVTAWITACLLEIQALGGEFKPKREQIDLALDAIGIQYSFFLIFMYTCTTQTLLNKILHVFSTFFGHFSCKISRIGFRH